MKVYDNLRVEGGVGRESSEYTVEMRMSALRADYTKKGGCDNAIIERIFSLMAYLVVSGAGQKKGRVLRIILTTLKINDRGGHFE